MRGDVPGVVGIAVVTCLLWTIAHYRASWMPFWAPWDFSPLWFLAAAFTLWWFFRGLRAVPMGAGRIVLFLIGMAAIWAVLQTHFEYAAQHMFFLNRIQHVVMHHLGPFLIALAWPWQTIAAGMPGPVRRVASHRHMHAVMRFFRQPEIAIAFFLGLIALWLWPPVHFVAMINPALYTVMNWSMVIDGLLFWAVVLDPRGAGQAGNSFAMRAVMSVGIIFPQIALGAIIAFADSDIYGFYAWCGRLYPGIDAISDQRLGGGVVWIPPAMMSVVGLICVLNNMRREQERTARPGNGGVSSAGWTGR
ncbi:cytochrome c oxidase assembly protein [Stakelama sp. CBK3Z-3]|uniref:Cytochrome c oxidase assembly protein n=1 Tax=Stakelama flava TaxID=2860338 RepID=A0ABS6XH90_9SPHN|nr:cytochrome c oxidase assembly protein [Stakelama flava]MBW4329575.1 cytochrome c oxidase assembly protein [Stakelama flava]